MIEFDADVAIVGSGFGGSLLALISGRLGLRTVLIDRASHPRFILGESTTPIANMVLRDLCRRYDLSQLEPICQYGTALQAHPQLVMGINRGSSFYRHDRDQPFQPQKDRGNELLVAFSPDDNRADTQWLRADVDQFFFRQARAARVATMERTDITECTWSDGRWCVSGFHSEEPVRVWVPLVVDASGENGVVLRSLGIDRSGQSLKTNTRTLYGHFTGVASWHELYQQAGGQTADLPFHGDHAAAHHVIEGGWLRQFHFRNGVTSAGLVLDQARHPVHPDRYPDDEWHAILEHYPTLAQQYKGARLAEATPHLVGINRLQRRATRAAGEGWAALPNTAGFIDPLFGTTIAHTMCGVERLAAILEQGWGRDDMNQRLEGYDQQLQTEFSFLDSLVHACYRAMDDFPRFTSVSMLYFAAASEYQRRRTERLSGRATAFLCADDPELQQAVDRCLQRLDDDAGTGQQPGDAAEFDRWIAEQIRPFNQVGLCDPAARNIYRLGGD
jgi:tetracycline 7-halogenase / FADH2 O2-dependent halogenase